MPTHEFSTVDTHTAGMPTRVVVDGPTLPAGETVRARRDAFAETLDDARRFLVCEPRGHSGMFAAVPIEPSTPGADIGLFFMDTGGYLDMCGHATIGAVTALVETGRVDATDELVVETPAGLVATTPHVVDGHVREVTFENVPSAFVETRTVHAGTHDMVDVDVVSAGNVAAIVEADAVGLDLRTAPASRIAAVGVVLRDLVNEQGTVTDPVTGRTLDVRLVEFTETTADAAPNRTAVVFGDGAVDRSPCGTGTSARMTLHAHRGDLAAGDSFAHTGPTGGTFSGRVLGVEDGVYRTAVTGSAHVTGHHTFLRHADDPLDAFTLE